MQNAGVSYEHWQGVVFGNAELVAGDISFSARSLGVAPGRVLHVSGSARMLGTAWTLASGGGDVWLDVGGHAFNQLSLSVWGGALRCGAENVLGSGTTVKIAEGKVDARAFCLDLAGKGQELAAVANANVVAEGADTYSLVTSGEPATLRMTTDAEVAASMKFCGAVSVEFAGTGSYRLINQVSDSSGALTVSSGTFTLAANAGWTGSDVQVCGGHLVCASPLSVKNGVTALTVSGGKLTVGDGVTLKVSAAVIDSVALEDGKTYTVAELQAAGLSDYVDGSGSIEVVEYEPPDPEGPFVWPDEEGATAIVRLNETVFIYDADVPKVAKLGMIKMRAGACVVCSNLTAALTLSAEIKGQGVFMVRDSAGLTLAGDNSLFTGHFDFANSVIGVRHRYGLGSAANGTGKALYDRKSKGSLDFYSETGVITNDVPIQVSTTVLTGNTTPFNALSTDRLVQLGDVEYTAYQALVLGNVDMLGGRLGGGCNAFAAADNREFHIGGAASFGAAAVSLGYGGAGRLVVDGGAASLTQMKMTDTWGHPVTLGADNVFGAATALLLGREKSDAQTCYVDLNGTAQTLGYAGNSAATAVGSDLYSIVTSADPASLTMKSSATNSASVKFRGAVSVAYAGTGVYTLINQISDATGTLSVTSGEMVLGAGSGWRGAKVVVSGGKLSCDSALAVVGCTAALELADVAGSELALGNGVTLEVASMTVGGAPVANGTYSAADLQKLCSAAVVSGAGSVQVGKGGEETFKWPDEEGGSATVPANATVIVTDADAAGVARTGALVLKPGSKMVFANETIPLTLAAAVSGAGMLCADGSVGLTLSGDNSGYTGQTVVSNSVIAVTSRYGLGTSVTPEAFFYRALNKTGTLDFYGEGLTNDVAIQVEGFNVQTSGVARLIQQNAVRRKAGTTPTFGNVTVNNGQLVGVGSAFGVNVAEGCAFEISGAAYINTWTWNARFSGKGALRMGATTGTHQYGFITMDADAALVCEGADVLKHGDASNNGSIGLTAAAEPAGGLDLNGYDQEVNTIDVSVSGSAFAIVTSASPATVKMTSATDRRSAIAFTGAAGFWQAGNSTYTIANGKSQTTGALKVTAGMVAFEVGTGWTGPVELAGGALSLAEGLRLKVPEMTVGGVKLAFGTYGSAEAAAAGVVDARHVLQSLSGLGCVRVGTPGLLLMVK